MSRLAPDSPPAHRFNTVSKLSASKSVSRRTARGGGGLAAIRLRGVRQNNLRNIDIDIPLGKLVVVTGRSGAGKSSLVFETLHAEGQRRYVETFSPYTRQFLDMMDKPAVDAVENIRPSIAIEQSNTIRTSRSTVGTMTELCDFFKVWFAQVARLHDPDSGALIEDDNPQTIWRKILQLCGGDTVLLTFAVKRPQSLKWAEVIEPIERQGFIRSVAAGEVLKTSDLTASRLHADLDEQGLFPVVDRITIQPKSQARFIEAATTALHFGRGELQVWTADGSRRIGAWSEGLHIPGTDRRFAPASPALFSFNSPIGACPHCRGFGRIVTIDPNLVIPDSRLSINAGAIKAFAGEVYKNSLEDFKRCCGWPEERLATLWEELSAEERAFVWDGDPAFSGEAEDWNDRWYGIHRFFRWLEDNTYKMHVRVFLSRFRSYVPCPECGGTRLQPEGLMWRWQGLRLPDLYRMPVDQLLQTIEKAGAAFSDRAGEAAVTAILSRLRYLEAVGLGYLSLDRASRTLSGGEVERVNLTACLGTALVDTLFVLDEPSVGLHARDIDRLIAILRRLTDQGNTVVVVEHDEAVMRAADHLIEIGPNPGAGGGTITYNGPAAGILKESTSLTGNYLSGRLTIPPPRQRRPVKANPGVPLFALHFTGVTCHNLHKLDIAVPLRRLVVLSGVSGSGKSTLLNNVIYQGLQRKWRRAADSPAQIEKLEGAMGIRDAVWVDQGQVSRTPRSTPVLYVEAWDPIRTLFAQTEEARAAGLSTAHFSFNSGQGRCGHCGGTGFEKVEMQFLSDVFITCPICDGKRFRQETLAIKWRDKTVADILAMTVDEACTFFADTPAVKVRLDYLRAVGLGYLPLGQPLNTLSGGESQRLKLVRYLGSMGGGDMLILLDEPTTGLHRDDVRTLLNVLQSIVDAGNSVVVIEHQMDIIAAADWIIEMGPGAGYHGGRCVAAGPPEKVARKATETAPFLRQALGIAAPKSRSRKAAAARKSPPAAATRPTELTVSGAREHNLKNITVSIPHGKLSVITGVSGSGKSSLAFDIIFAEGQRRFMESMSPYARQFVEQLPRPAVDSLRGLAPSVAIEQRVTRGSRKSTVATITEVAQYLRLLFARIGIQHNPRTGTAVEPLSEDAVCSRVASALRSPPAKKGHDQLLAAPLIRGRKGHHEPVATWAREQGYELLRIDGRIQKVASFERLDRYSEHDIEVIIRTFPANEPTRTRHINQAVQRALKIGKGTCMLVGGDGAVHGLFSTLRSDPVTGESFPELDPKHFSWNSPRGWCPTCRGHGWIYPWMADDDDYGAVEQADEGGNPCPDCNGARLNPISSAVKVPISSNSRQHMLSLPELLALTPEALLDHLQRMQLDRRGKAVVTDILPQIEERLAFLTRVGLGYLSMDRPTNTLSGGEAQRIRLAAQLGSTLSGVLYVLDEPSIGLHARDNARLLETLNTLKSRGNTLIVVEHDEETMMAADHIIDLGPAAGVHGGEVLAAGSPARIRRSKSSLTGQFLRQPMAHPVRGHYRTLPKRWTARQSADNGWTVLTKARFRNLKNVTLSLPRRALTVICGISGAGKSTLLRDLLLPSLRQAVKSRTPRLEGAKMISAGLAAPDGTAPFEKLLFGNAFRQIIEVDQQPIGKTPRSTPATYIGVFDLIRDFYAALPESRMRGHSPGFFSFNTKGGRCEKCNGAGRIKLEMNFMPDTYVDCDACNGARYGPEVTAIQWHGKSIADVLAMTFEEAAELFAFAERIATPLRLMVETGLGYLTLGQSSPSLSGGEAQRLKLVSELAKGAASSRTHPAADKGNFYLLEEPTIGLHLSDCRRLIDLLHRLVEQGHTVAVIEHHLDIIAEADYAVEIGPEGGQHGGQILYQGPLAGLLSCQQSRTRPFLPDFARTGC